MLITISAGGGWISRGAHLDHVILMGIKLTLKIVLFKSTYKGLDAGGRIMKRFRDHETSCCNIKHDFCPVKHVCPYVLRYSFDFGI
jgi:hypothetical protein